MKFWQSLALTEPEQLLALAKVAEESGFHGVLVSDHVFLPEKLASKYPYSPDGAPGFDARTPFPEPWSTIAAMAAVTTRLQFATIIYILPLRNPLLVAKATSSIVALCGKRLALGVGAGWMKEEFDTLGVDFRTRGKRLEEMIEVLHELWRGGVVEHHGRFFDFDRLQMSPAPGESLPVYIGGLSAAALRRAARLGDGWIGPGNAPDEVPGILRELERLREEAGRASRPFETIVPITASLEPELLRRLEGQGVSAVVSYPFAYTLGPDSTLEQRCSALRRFGDEVIVPTNRG